MKKETSLVFTGDIGFDKFMDGRFDDEELLSDAVLDFLHSGDHVVANVEGAILDPALSKDSGGKGRFFHTMDPKAVKVLKKMKADIWNFANNHTMDGGKIGMESSLKAAAEAGVQTIGAGMNVYDAMKPVILQEAGGIGILGMGIQPICVRATPVEPGSFAWDELDRIEAQIKMIKETCRWCVLVIHAGEEFTTLPAPYNRARYLKLLELGADVIIAHHPHVPMNYETFPGKAVFYSLGNFIFDTEYQRAQLNTDIGVLLKLRFTEDSFSFEPFGTKLDRTTEHIGAGPLPGVFADIQKEEYEKLVPTACRAFLKAEKKKCIFLHPETYEAYTDEQWKDYFNDITIAKRVSGWFKDLPNYYETASREDSEAFASSGLEGVKAYIEAEL